MIYTGDEVLETMNEYAVNRNNQIFGLILKYFKVGMQNTRHQNTLEFGAGRGEFIDRFKQYPKIETFAAEIDPIYIKTLKRKHKVIEDIFHCKVKFDNVLAIDVFEHIEDDVAMLKIIYATMKKGGKLFIYVPARPELYSRFDKRIGHYRRYVLSELRSKVGQAGFSVEKAYYHDFLGYFAAIFNKLTSRGDLNPKMVKLYDRLFFPLTMIAESIISPPFGKSICLLARRI